MRRLTVAFTTAALMLGGGVALGAAPGSAASGAYGIGDSVMLGAKPQLASHGIKVNASVSRQYYEVKPLIKKLRKKGKLPGKVVIAVGLNTSGIRLSQCRAIVAAAGSSRQVWLVTMKNVRPWVPANNRVFTKCAATTRASLIPWHSYSRGHRNWFWGDGVHLTPRGARAYAAYLDRFV